MVKQIIKPHAVLPLCDQITKSDAIEQLASIQAKGGCPNGQSPFAYLKYSKEGVHYADFVQGAAPCERDGLRTAVNIAFG